MGSVQKKQPVTYRVKGLKKPARVANFLPDLTRCRALRIAVKSNGNSRVNLRGRPGSSGCTDGLHGNSHLILGRVIGAEP